VRVNAIYCKVSNEIDLFEQTRLLFWFKGFTIKKSSVSLGLLFGKECRPSSKISYIPILRALKQDMENIQVVTCTSII